MEAPLTIFEIVHCNKKIIQEIYNYRYEVGYHYEEIATFEKNNKLKNKNEILNHVIQKMFLDDYNNFKLKSEVPCYSVSSHGDFVNVKLNISNKVLLTSDEVRKEAGIVVEAYDDIIENNIKKRYADQEYLGFFSNNVIDSLLNGNSPILILTHPRQWKVDICENSKDNFRRLYQGLHYRIF